MSEQNKTRYTLIQRLRNINDEDAWAEFSRFYWDLIRGWARMFGCPDSMINDVFQETMLCLLKNMPDFQLQPEKGNFRSYLKTIVHRRVTDAFRRESRYIAKSVVSNGDGGEEDFIESLADTAPTGGADAEMDTVWLKSVLSEALRHAAEKVEPLTYKSFCLFVFEELPIAEVAKRLKISREETVYQHKDRFIRILQREFAGMLIELGEGAIDPKKLNDRGSLFNKALQELVKGTSEYRNTIVHDLPPVKLLHRIDFVRKMLESSPTPEGSGACLLCIDSEKNTRDWCDIKDKFSAGRNESCDLTIDFKGVSGLHFSISKTPEAYLLRDEQSRNGVYVNGGKIVSEVLLKDGDAIQITPNQLLVFSTRN